MATTAEDVIAAIYGQESGSGKADTSKVNSSNVTGPMQVQEATFNGLKKNGLIPATANWRNPADNKAAGDAHVRDLFNKFGGDPKKVAAAYYAGEKAVKADGSIANYRDLKNPNNPSTHQYVDDIMRRLGQQPSSRVDDKGVATVVTGLPELTDWMVPALDPKLPKGKAIPVAKDAPITDVGLKTSPVYDTAAADAAATTAAQAAQQATDDLGVIDIAQRKFMPNTLAGAALRKMVMDDFLTRHKPEPGYTVDPKEFAGHDEAEQEFIATAANDEHLAFIKADIEHVRELRKESESKGLGYSLVGDLIAGFPEGFGEGVIATRGLQLARMGSLSLASQGRTGAAFASSLAENAGANVLAAGVQDSIDPYMETDTYAMGLAMGGAVSLLHIPGILKSSRTGSTLRALQAMEDAAGAKIAARREQAVKNVGADATPETLQAEVQRLEADEIRRETEVHTAAVPEDRRLIPEDEQLRSDVPEAEAPAKAPDEPVAAPETATEATVAKEADAALEAKAVDPAVPAAQRQQAVDETPSAREQADEWINRDAAQEENLFELYRTSDQGKAFVKEHMEGVANLGWVERQGPGVHALPGWAELAKGRLKATMDAIETIHQRIFPETTLVVGEARLRDGASGSILSLGRGMHLMAMNPADGARGSLRTALHEMAHMVTHEKLRHASPDLVKRLIDEFEEFRAHVKTGRNEHARFARFNEGSPNLVDARTGGVNSNDLSQLSEEVKAYYTDNFDEWLAEGGARFFQRDARNGNKVGLTSNVLKVMRDSWEAVKQLFGIAKEKGWIPKDEAIEEFFRRALDGTLKDMETVKAPEFLDAGLVIPDLTPSASRNRTLPQQQADFANDKFNIDNGLHLMPTKTVTEAAEAKAVSSLYKKAKEHGYVTDNKRLSWLMNTALFQGAQGVANVMLRSKNAVVRMVASELAENAGGAGGRRSTAAIAKHLNEQAYLGNTLNEVQSHYGMYRKSRGVLPTEDIFGGKTWADFNRSLATEIESRRPGATPVESHPAVKAAADSLEKAYERIRKAQTSAKTIGWASLPESSKGYMPHRMNPEKLANATQAQIDVLHTTLMDQFQMIEGFDATFSANLASKYIDRIRATALGGFSPPMGIHQVGAADVVEDALKQMGLGREEITQMMKRYMAGGAGHTKRRLQLDLNKAYPVGDGETFKLMDLFETDQFKLLRTQAQRVSGEVALAGHGVMGMPGMKLLRRAMEFGGDGERATRKELEAFDQIAAEMLGMPFGTQNKLVDRAIQANSLARLGGMGFTQFSESINGVWSVGATRTLAAIGSMGRLRSEIKALARGEKVNNPIIGSFEQYRGVDFGTDSYKTVFPFDNGAREVENFGADSLTAADRLLRGASHLQGRLSFWRSIHATQQRGFAEQIVRKAAQYLRDGTNDVALRDMGFSDDLMARLRKELPNLATFDLDGRLMDFDITKAADKAAAEEMTQAIHRGVGQIIQGAFIGERGAWAHDGVMRLMTQFRTFGLTSIEKQWARQTGNVGTAKAFGMLIGSVSMAAPVYMVRTYLASIGRKDQQEYLDKQLAWEKVARASLNYVAMSGLAGDLLDATSSVTGLGGSTGGRSGGGSDFVGSVVAPSASLANDLYQGIQNTKEGTDPHQLMKALPFSRHPLLIPAINALD